MKIGVAFPRQLIGTDLGKAREFMAVVDRAGYDLVAVGEHILGVDPSTRPGWLDKPSPLGAGPGLYGSEEVFHDPFVLITYLSRFSDSAQFVTSTLTAPIRQTVIIAKQATTLDWVTGGRIILGFGVGWNSEEYVALGMDFHNRGRRLDEQVEVLRALWAHEVVNFKGEFHDINAMGIAPRPPRTIPIWFGGGPGGPAAVGGRISTEKGQERVLRRVARIGDGWLTGNSLDPRTDGLQVVERLRGYTADAGRDPKDVGIHGTVLLAKNAHPEQWADRASGWRDAGATHLGLVLAGGEQSDPKYATFEGTMEAVAEFKDAVS